MVYAWRQSSLSPFSKLLQARDGLLQRLHHCIHGLRGGAIGIERSTQLLERDAGSPNARAIHQARSWGFEEFRIMAEPTKMLAFFRKSID